MKTEKIVSIIAWIPIQIVSYHIASWLFYFITAGTAPFLTRCVYYRDELFYQFCIQFLAFALIGLLILFRYEYGSKKFWKYFLLLYIGYHIGCSAVYYLEPHNQNTWFGITACCFFSALSLLGLMLVSWATRGVMYLITKIIKKAPSN